MSTPQPMTPEQEAAIRDHVSANREALRRATNMIVRHCGGMLMGTIAVGMDPGVDDPLQRWWAKVRLQGGRAGTEVIAEHHPSALAALDALVPRIRLYRRSRSRR